MSLNTQSLGKGEKIVINEEREKFQRLGGRRVIAFVVVVVLSIDFISFIIYKTACKCKISHQN